MISNDSFQSYKEGYDKAKKELYVKIIDIINQFSANDMTIMERERFAILKKKILDKFTSISVSALCKHNTPLTRRCILCEYEAQNEKP